MQPYACWKKFLKVVIYLCFLLIDGWRALKIHFQIKCGTSKIPYISSVFENAAMDIVQYIEAIKGKSRRLIILDLDNTLGGGVLGENGWQGLRLGGHDHVGEAFRDFQLALKALSNRGVQLAISSKNDEKLAMDAIDNHPEMILKKEDFVGWRINWNDKAVNIAELSEEQT